MNESLPPIGSELARQNRRIIAEQTAWPVGVVEVCEKLDGEFPGWHVSWSRGGGMLWKKPGLYAQRKEWHYNDGVPTSRWRRGSDEVQAFCQRPIRLPSVSWK